MRGLRRPRTSAFLEAARERIAERTVRAVGEIAPSGALHQVIGREVRARRTGVGHDDRILVQVLLHLENNPLRLDRRVVRARQRFDYPRADAAHPDHAHMRRTETGQGLVAVQAGDAAETAVEIDVFQNWINFLRGIHPVILAEPGYNVFLAKFTSPAP